MKNDYGKIVFTICLASSLVPFMGSAMNLALPYIGADLKLGVVVSGWVPTSYMLSTAIFQIPCARIADIVGRKKIFLWGLLIFTFFSALSGWVGSGTALILYRFLSGIGSAMLFGTSMAILTSAVPPQKRGYAFGINTSVVYFSLAAGPLLGGILTQYLGWRSIFFAATAIGIIASVFAAAFLRPETNKPAERSFDLAGSVLYALGLSALIYGFTVLPAPAGIICTMSGLFLLFVFGKYEMNRPNPVFNISEFLSNKVFRLSTVSALINYSATFAVAFMLSLYLQNIRGMSPRDAGLIIITQSVMQAVVSLWSGRLSDKVSPTLLATTGMGIITLGLAGMTFLTALSPLILIVIFLLLLGLGFGLFSSPNTNIIMSSVDKANYGMASATTGTMRLTGQAFSMGIALMAVSFYVGPENFPRIYTKDSSPP